MWDDMAYSQFMQQTSPRSLDEISQSLEGFGDSAHPHKMPDKLVDLPPLDRSPEAATSSKCHKMPFVQDLQDVRALN